MITQNQIELIFKFYNSGDPEARQYVFSNCVKLPHSGLFENFNNPKMVKRDLRKITKEEANNVIASIRNGLKERREWAKRNPICVQRGHIWDRHVSDGLYNIGFQCSRCGEMTAGYMHIGPFNIDNWVNDMGEREFG